MKKQILSKAMWESDTNQILKEYGLRKPRIITVPRFAPSPEPVPASVLAPVPAPVFAQVPAPDCEVYDDTVCLGTTKPEIYEEEIASDQHIKIVEKTDKMIAAAAASNEPKPEYEIVWRKQDRSGNRRKPFTPPTDSAREVFNRRLLQNCQGRQTPNDNNAGTEDPTPHRSRYRDEENEFEIPRDAPSVLDPTKPMSRKEREWLSRRNGEPIEPILTIFGPDHFTHHAGHPHQSCRTMYQLETGEVVDGMKSDDDVPVVEPMPLKIGFNRERMMLEGNERAKDDEEF